MNASAIMTEIITLLVGGLKEMATGIGEGLSSLAKAIFLQTTGAEGSQTTSLSVFGMLIVIFAGISLAVGLSRWVVNFVTSLGARNR